jgi:hypothetical protein
MFEGCVTSDRPEQTCSDMNDLRGVDMYQSAMCCSKQVVIIEQ